MPHKQSANEVEDIFAETDSSGRQDRATKKSEKATPLEISDTAVQPNPPTTPEHQSAQSASHKKMILLVVIPVIIVAAAAAIIVIGPFGILPDTPADTANTPVGNTASGTQPSANQTAQADTPAPTTPTEIDPAITDNDSDGDGLSDSEEREAGTDPRRVDTDNDGLFDRDEVVIYNTNPRNPDTDGDGNNDGVEVINGFDPNGPGLLRDLDAAIEALENS